MLVYATAVMISQALTNHRSFISILSSPRCILLYCCVGQLGLEDTTNRGNSTVSMGDNLPFVALGAGDTVVEVVAANHFTCVLLHDETVK